MTDIDHRIAMLEAQLAELKAEVRPPAPLATETPDEAATHDRRTMFKKLALGAAGVAAAGTVGALSGAMPAAAADGNSILIGTDGGANNSGTLPTGVNFTGANTAGVGFMFQDGTTWTAAAANYPSTLGAYASVSGKPRNGVYGYTQWADHAGVVGYGSAGVPGTIGARFQGARADINLVSNGALTTVAGVAHVRGDIVVTDDGDLWYCAADGTPGTLRKLSGATTAGQLHVLASPVRVYDSRPASNGPAATNEGPLGGGAERTVSLANGFVGTTATPGVPAGATAALITLTVSATTNGGFLAVFSNAVAYGNTSNINWSASNQDIATTTVSAVDAAAKVKLHAGGSPTGTQFIIDVIGYYQ